MSSVIVKCDALECYYNNGAGRCTKAEIPIHYDTTCDGYDDDIEDVFGPENTD